MSEFEGLVAIVTGGASGIGAETTRLLLERGARVAVFDLDPAGADERALKVTVDVADSASVEAAVARTVEKLGGLDIVINNAGMGAQGDLAANDDDEWRRVFEVNVLGMVRVARAALPHLRRSSAPAIVNTSSVAATAGIPQRVLYSASKGAVHSMTRAMAADHIREGIRVNCVVPGTANTPWVGRLLDKADDPAAERAALNARQPHGRLVEPTEVAEGIVFLASPRNRSTTGAALTVDGGMEALRLRPAE